MSTRRLLIVTGDPSGDMHAARVVQALGQIDATIKVAAVGGPALQAEGVYMLADQRRMGQVGFGAFTGAPYHYLLGRKILRFVETFRPDGVLLIDYGVFNLWLAAQLKRRGCRVFYYIPPQVWASRRGRIRKIKANVDHVFCIFPFEEDLYRAEGIAVTYTGHPLPAQLPPAPDRQAWCAARGWDAADKILALLPGSRRMEIGYLLAPMIAALPAIRERFEAAHPSQKLRFVLAQAPSLPDAFFHPALDRALRAANVAPEALTIVKGEAQALLGVADAGIIASGTATLEAALYQTPMVIVYKGHPVAAWLARKLCKLPCLGLPNILTDMNAPAVPELLQEALTPAALAEHLLPLLDPETREWRRAQRAFEEIRAMLGTKNAAETVAAELVRQLIRLN